MSRDITRRCRFSPYRAFKPYYLTMWDTHRTDTMGKSILGYELKHDGQVLFSGEDFSCSPLHCIDSDECVRSLMTFLTLSPGDTDSEYFATYNEAQLDFARTDAPNLSVYLSDRFGE